jgi:vacuolar protein 8
MVCQRLIRVRIGAHRFAALSALNRKKLAQSEPKLISSLVQLMDSPSLKVQCQAALALRNLASDGK